MGLDVCFGGFIRLSSRDSCLEPGGFFERLELLGVVVVEDHGCEAEGFGCISDGVAAEGFWVPGDGF